LVVAKDFAQAAFGAIAFHRIAHGGPRGDDTHPGPGGGAKFRPGGHPQGETPAKKTPASGSHVRKIR
jgi:hypothetical protein